MGKTRTLAAHIVCVADIRRCLIAIDKKNGKHISARNALVYERARTHARSHTQLNRNLRKMTNVLQCNAVNVCVELRLAELVNCEL